MIISALLKLIVAVLSFIVGFIPSMDFGFSISEYLQPLLTVMMYVDLFISVDALILCVSAIFIVDNLDFFIRIFSWLWDKIPFI